MKVDAEEIVTNQEHMDAGNADDASGVASDSQVTDGEAGTSAAAGTEPTEPTGDAGAPRTGLSAEEQSFKDRYYASLERNRQLEEKLTAPPVTPQTNVAPIDPYNEELEVTRQELKYQVDNGLIPEDLAEKKFHIAARNIESRRQSDAAFGGFKKFHAVGMSRDVRATLADEFGVSEKTTPELYTEAVAGLQFFGIDINKPETFMNVSNPEMLPAMMKNAVESAAGRIARRHQVKRAPGPGVMSAGSGAPETHEIPPCPPGKNPLAHAFDSAAKFISVAGRKPK